MLERCIQLVEAAGCNPKSMNFHLNELGLLLMKMGLYREAVPVLRRAQSLIIEHENALYRLATASLGGALVNLGQFREAFELLEPIQRRRVEHRGEVPQDEITEWFNKAKEAVDSAPKRKPKARSGHPKKKR
jgi:tetratricopeptide (TPR) repeat protein